jgi:hypothetical protein
MTLISISSDDYDQKSSIFINGQPFPVPLDTAFDASASLLEVLDHAGIPYAPVVAPGSATGRIKIQESKKLTKGNIVHLAINGTAIARVVGSYYTPLAGEAEVLASASLPVTAETSGGTIPISISGSPSFALVGSAYSFTPTTTNGSGTKVFSYTGTALAGFGLSFNTATGAITGTVTGSAGTITGTISVTDSSGSDSLPISVAVIVPVAISGTPGGATIGSAYSFTPTATNGSGTKTFSYAGTSLAGYGLSFNTTTGAITGTVAGSAGTITGTITVSDTSGTANLPITIAVSSSMNSVLAEDGTTILAEDGSTIIQET